MKITTIVGARPQFIKASYLSTQFSDLGVDERLLHTGQHYDSNMSDIFFDELQIPKPAKNLNIGGGSHGVQTSQMLMAVEQDLLDNQPDAVLVYGDTNSTLAGALSAIKLHLPVIHIEAGLRSFDKKMPEEINRILTDNVSSKLLCPTPTAVRNLADEGITQGVHLIGDVMHPVLLGFSSLAQSSSNILEQLSVLESEYYLATIHRADNTDDSEVLKSIIETLSALDRIVVLPLHPRTAGKVEALNLQYDTSKIKVVEPVGYLDMIALIKGAKIVLTDSGGLQKEAVWLSTPCVTMRSSTEWVETLDSGWNTLTGTNPKSIIDAVEKYESISALSPVSVETFSAQKIVDLFL